MGVSTDAYLYFGFDFCDKEDGDQLPWASEDAEGDEPEWDTAYIAKAHPSRDITKLSWKERERLLKGVGGEVDYHCHHEFPIYFVAVPRLKFCACRGDPMTLDEISHPTADEIEALRKFCEVLSIPWQEPKWHLASYWG